MDTLTDACTVAVQLLAAASEPLQQLQELTATAADVAARDTKLQWRIDDVAAGMGVVRGTCSRLVDLARVIDGDHAFGNAAPQDTAPAADEGDVTAALLQARQQLNDPVMRADRLLRASEARARQDLDRLRDAEADPYGAEWEALGAFIREAHIARQALAYLRTMLVYLNAEIDLVRMKLDEQQLDA